MTGDEDLNVLVTLKPNGERYVFLYSSSQRARVLRVLHRFAMDPDLSFSPLDCAMAARRVIEKTPRKPR